MKHLTKLLASVLSALGLNQAAGTSDISDFRETLQLAERGNAQAQYNLGVMYKNGRGVRQDDTEAVKWFRQAAAQGLAPAPYNLGWMYANGRGVLQDRALAQEWFGKACQNGDQDGCNNYQRLKAGY